MKRIVVVGSGASGVHFALSALEKGHEVVLLDVGHTGPPPLNPSDSFVRLKATLPDPISYFLGSQFETVRFPSDRNEYYGFPPNKQYVFAGVPQFRARASGFDPLASFARGGLAEAWTGGTYPLNDAELADFPLTYDDLAPYYARVARRIGVSGESDDLADVMPVHDGLQAPLRLDPHGQHLYERYRRTRVTFARRLSCRMGRSRVATLSQDLDDRRACGYLGRCLWGCPIGSLYTPSVTLDACHRYASFRYCPGRHVSHFTFDEKRRVTSIIADTADAATPERVPIDSLVLAAGTLSSTRIFLESMRRGTGAAPVLRGLMDNRQIMMPFVTLAMIGRPADPDTYQYHQLCLGFEAATAKEYVHAQLTTLTTALIHPIVQSVPVDLAAALTLFGNVHAALGLANVNLHDTRRHDSFVTLDDAPDNIAAPLLVQYVPPADEPLRLRRELRRIRKALWMLGCIVPPFMTHIRPMGASVHYAGTLPMTTAPAPLTTSRDGRSHDFDNLFFVDGTTFPFLPAKNLTLTLMANAARIADTAF